MKARIVVAALMVAFAPGVSTAQSVVASSLPAAETASSDWWSDPAYARPSATFAARQPTVDQGANRWWYETHSPDVR